MRANAVRSDKAAAAAADVADAAVDDDCVVCNLSALSADSDSCNIQICDTISGMILELLQYACEPLGM